jgi:hypothetical protein
MPGTGALLLLVFASLVVVLLLVFLQLTRLGFLIRSTIPDRPRRRMFIASVSFLITFVGVRLLVSLVTHQHGPFEWVMVRGRHIHHLVWGILILLLVGYGSGPLAFAHINFSQPPHVGQLWSWGRSNPR